MLFIGCIAIGLVNVNLQKEMVKLSWDYDKELSTYKQDNYFLKKLLSEYSVFQKALDTIDPTEYKKETNNCYDYSQRFQKALADKMIASSIFVNKDRSHSWVGVWVDAVDGKFLYPGEHDVLELRDKNLDVICD